MQLLSPKLKSWWQSLSDNEKQGVSSIDVPEIMSDIANVANNALLVCKLHPDCKDKDLIVWKKSKTENEGIVTHTFTLNLLGKEVLGKNLDEAFSSFSVFIAREVKTSHTRAKKEDRSVNLGPKSCFNVKQEKLKDLLDLLSNSMSNYTTEVEKILLQTDKTPFELYSLLVDFSSKQLFSDLTIPSYLKKLFDRFASSTFLIARSIHFTYCERFGLDPLATQVTNQLNELFSLVGQGDTQNKPGLMFAKTVSQIEKEQAEDCADEQSTDNDESPKELPKVMAEAFAFYEGCYLGDLEINFDSSDSQMIEEEDPLQKFHNYERSYGSEDGDGDSRGSQEGQEDNYYVPNQHMMGYMQPVYPSQGHHYAYYPEYYTAPGSYGYMDGDQGYYQGGYDQQHSRKKSFESQSSYGSDKENFSSQYGDGYYGKDDQFSYYKKKTPSFDTRSKLPPRFQRKRDGNYRV